ncbi:class I SAM-dependent methyltransferase [Candidatus Daviesbacteria bacterium]|nr:class I SAM-dependent methyltransferase [Candidatus Daviesbacteria bacterium]
MIDNLPFTYPWLIKRNIKKFKINTILDLGCGKGAFGDLVNNEGKYQITGADIFQPYLKICKSGGKYKKVMKVDLIKKLPFDDKSFDMVVSLQTVEHLDKKDGFLLIKEMERIAKTLILLTTPNGDCLQEEYDANKYQRHLSAWLPKDFKGKGFRVFGTGLKLVYGSHSHAGNEIKLIQLPLYFISFLMNPVANINPNIAAQVIAIKWKK